MSATNLCSILPVGDRLLIRKDEKTKTTPGGIIVETVAEDVLKGAVAATVVAVGPGWPAANAGEISYVSTVPSHAKRVLLNSAHTAIVVDDPDNPGKKLHIIEGRDVLAVLA